MPGAPTPHMPASPGQPVQLLPDAVEETLQVTGRHPSLIKVVVHPCEEAHL
jgi:hypothetical protein